ncbi:MAG: ATP-binding protein [Muribaculaceae bacterium]|nr:ATP-binding protein [Muribaculaceae bacterium]
MRYPIGRQDFQTLREDGCVYIDKTRLVYELVQNPYVFLSRPRRFGKSLLLSTIKAYFEGKKELFEGLEIERLEKDWAPHPVFLISLARVMDNSNQSLRDLLNQQFFLWEKDLGINNQNPDFGSRFSSILQESFRQSGKRAVVLIDEYDNPLINSLSDSKIHEANLSLLKSIYTNLKDLDAYIRFGMLTGVSRFSKMSIFSGLNNLTDVSFDPKFAAICGITENELLNDLSHGIENLAKHLNSSPQEAFYVLKKHYDGYHFTFPSPDIYNPFSLLSALDALNISDYWFATATPTFLIQRLYESNVDIPSLLNPEAPSAALSSSDANHDSPVALLFQTGYLTIKDFDSEWELYRLGVPNLEVKKGLMFDMAKIFQKKDEAQSLKLIKQLTLALRQGEPEIFLTSLQSYLASIPANITQNKSELYFENNIYIILSLLGIYIQTETVISKGRIDIVIQSDKYVYVIELKLDKTPEEALRQINEKEYALPFLHSGKQVFNIGINFSSEIRNISSWLIQPSKPS